MCCVLMHDVKLQREHEALYVSSEEGTQTSLTWAHTRNMPFTQRVHLLSYCKSFSFILIRVIHYFLSLVMCTCLCIR